MITYIATPAPAGTAVSTHADRSYHDARHQFVHTLGASCAADAATQLRTAVKDYERHVLAWYALGRSADAQAARNTIARQRHAI